MEFTKDPEFMPFSDDLDQPDFMFDLYPFGGCNYIEEFMTTKKQDPTEVIAKKIKAEELGEEFKPEFSLCEGSMDIRYDFTDSTLNQDVSNAFIFNFDNANSSSSQTPSKICKDDTSEKSEEKKPDSELSEILKPRPVLVSSTSVRSKKESTVDKGKRFSKKNDADLFKILRKLCEEKGTSIKNFWKDDLPLVQPESSILLDLTLQVGWKRNRKIDLLKRIRRIGRKQSFSVRETKLLRRLMNQQRKQGTHDYESVLEHFPGKTLEDVIKRFNETS